MRLTPIMHYDSTIEIKEGYMKPKEWLFENGHIDKVGRGRLSEKHKALIAEAVAKGVHIEGYSVSKVSTSKDTAPKVQKADPSRMLDVPDALRDERDMLAYRYEDGKPVEVGFRTVCNGCKSSLGWCPCREPRVWVDHATEAVVYFKPRLSQTKG